MPLLTFLFVSTKLSAPSVPPPSPSLTKFATAPAPFFTPPLRLSRSELSLPRLLVRAGSSPAGALSTLVPNVGSYSDAGCTRWVVSIERPPPGVGLSRAEVIDYYVDVLTVVLGSDKEAQMCIYYASWQDSYCFKCNIGEESARKLLNISRVLSVKPDTDEEQTRNNYTNSSLSVANKTCMDDNPKLSKSCELNHHWLVRTERPSIDVVTRAQVVDYYTMMLMKVLGNEKDAQVSIYRISWEKDFWFCCHIDELLARELADLNEVLSVEQDNDFSSNNKNDGGENLAELSEAKDQVPDVRTKRLFVTGLSFYTSEKTLRAAFEGFGELIEVKIIMDKISKRSKGYAFIEYTTEEAAAAALKEMNGKIINGWMIVVDVARANLSTRPRLRHSKP